MLSADSDGDQVQTGWMDSNGFEAEKMLYLFLNFFFLFLFICDFFHCLM